MAIIRTGPGGCKWMFMLEDVWATMISTDNTLGERKLRAGSAPRAPRWEGGPPPRPPASNACRMIQPSAYASVVLKMCIRCCLLNNARRHARLALNTWRHQVGFRKGCALRRGVGGWPPTARRAGELHLTSCRRRIGVRRGASPSPAIHYPHLCRWLCKGIRE